MKRDTLTAARKLQLEVEGRWSRRKHKKDAVLHLRIEAEIVERVKAEAKARQQSVSDYVRLRLVESFGAPLDNTQAPEFLLATSAWTAARTMNSNVCAICGEALPRGTDAWLANGPPPPPRLICVACYENNVSASGEKINTNQETNNGSDR